MEDEKASVADKISKAAVTRMANKTEEELRQITAKARASIDRKKQAAAASVGLKNYWVWLKQHPEEYARQLARRKETRLANLRHS
jgi:hypothetical protein